MLSLRFIQENQDKVVESLKIKNFEAKEIIQEVLKLDMVRKETQKELDDLLAESKQISKNIGILFKQGKADEANELKNRTGEIKELTHSLKEKQNQVSQGIQDLLVQIPNIPHHSVPPGKGEEDNQIIKENGTIPEIPNKKPHWELAKDYHIIDFDLGNKITGSGFPVYENYGSKLQRALINFFLDEGSSAGYKEYQPPIMVNEDSGFGTGQLPDKEGQMYHVGEDNLYLIPTAEVPLTNIFRDVILREEELPTKITAYTPCFRREAGSYGKDVRGLNRLHQFDKVEIVQIAHPEASYAILDEMVKYVESLIIKLELPYRILRLCGGDLSFTSALTFDFEVYSAGQDKWLEVSSVSNFESYQANRLKLRFKSKNNKSNVLAHTLNGSALALPRILASIIENNQCEQGIRIPKALQKYTGFDMIKA